VPQLGGSEIELAQLEQILKLSVDEVQSEGAYAVESRRALRLLLARQLMKAQVAPSFCGSRCTILEYRARRSPIPLYVRAIRRTDRLCADLWKTIQSEAGIRRQHDSVQFCRIFGRELGRRFRR